MILVKVNGAFTGINTGFDVDGCLSQLPVYWGRIFSHCIIPKFLIIFKLFVPAQIS